MKIDGLNTATHGMGSTVCLELGGRLDFTTAQYFRSAYSTCLRTAEQQVEISMADLQYIDSHGMALLLVAHRQAQGQGKTMVITRCSRDVMKVFRLVSFDKLLTIR